MHVHFGSFPIKMFIFAQYFCKSDLNINIIIKLQSI